MKGRELKLLFWQENAYLVADRPLTFQQLDLPSITKPFAAPAYWVIRVLHYSNVDRHLFCEILSYNVGDTNFGHRQQQLADELSNLQTIRFRNIDTRALIRTMTGITPATFLPTNEAPVYRSAPSYTITPLIPQPVKHTLTETFDVPFKHIRFRSGHVSFDRKFKHHNKPIPLSIPNTFLREEFDAVKNYFANVLGIRKIKVSASIEMEDNEVTATHATSPAIDQITTALVDEVRWAYLRAAKKKAPMDDDRNLFTMDAYFDTYGEENFPIGTFYADENALLEDLLTITDTKHYRHLRFLSKKHCHGKMKLRFIHQPFSFLFLLEGECHYHLIWETLDTAEATYVWPVEKTTEAAKAALSTIDKILNGIKVDGKMAYINTATEPFHRIFHDYSDQTDGFDKWKQELTTALT